LHTELKTDVGMLPQFQPLEDQAADTHRVTARNGSDHTAGMQHSRGEHSGKAKPESSPGRNTGDRGVSLVFVLARDGQPIMPCHPARARKLLRSGRARVHRRFPFTIRLIDVNGADIQPVRIKIDPGAKTTGIAIVREENGKQHVLHLAEIEHRGATVKKHLTQRAQFRRRRRSANLRYRKPRFENRPRSNGWLPPSLRCRVDNVLSWVSRYQGLIPISGISLERVKFDLQKMENPEISGVEYQQGTLYGYEVREYLLEKWRRRCAYCDAENVPLQIEHIQPRSKNGSKRISNLTLACEECNQKKDSLDIRIFLAHDPDRLKRILKHCKRPLAAAAAVNATRNALYNKLMDLGLPVEASSGGRTKFNRTRLGIPKTHALDAACVGEVENLLSWEMQTFHIKAMGRGSYKRTRLNKFGFPHGILIPHKKIYGFQTGDMVKAVVPKGKKAGTHIGRVAVRKTGSFNIQNPSGVVQGVSYKHCKILAHADGYNYSINLERSGVSSST
jgi:5-methylcytosine-specific restriction endonuclease McrA